MTIISVQGENILESLELVSEAQGDLTEPVYAILFDAHPELEPLFALDTDGGVRGSMLQYALECIMDYIGDRTLVTNFVSSSRYVHHGYGVPEHDFDDFFVAIMQCCQATLGARWTDAMDAEWQAMLKDLSNMKGI